MTLHPFMHVLYHLLMVCTLLMMTYKLFHVADLLKDVLKTLLVCIKLYGQVIDVVEALRRPIDNSETLCKSDTEEA